jgi:hypothetical protein
MKDYGWSWGGDPSSLIRIARRAQRATAVDSWEILMKNGDWLRALPRMPRSRTRSEVPVPLFRLTEREFGLSVTRRCDTTGRRLPDLVLGFGLRDRDRRSLAWRTAAIVHVNQTQYTSVTSKVKYLSTTKYSGRRSGDHKMLWSVFRFVTGCQPRIEHRSNTENRAKEY